MRIWNIARSGMLFGAAVLMSCKSLDVSNPNQPSSTVLTDPAILESLAGGTMHTWFNSYSLLEVTGVMDDQARTVSSSWNNGNMNFYSGIDVGPADTTTDPSTWTRNTRSWQNDLSATGRTSVLDGWTGMYAALSSANASLNAIRVQNVSIGSPAQTKRAETVAQFMQAATLMWLALDFDQAYYVNEKTDLHQPINTTITRKALRDSALVKLDATIALANANQFTTDATWANGQTYSSTQIAQIANTMAAMTIAWYPRDDGETSAAGVVDWTRVASYASKGMSTGKPVTFGFIGDGCNNWCQNMMIWFVEYSSGRVSTRVAHFMDPVTQFDPYPLGIGNKQPNSPDARMGDGSFGDSTIFAVYQNVPKTANGGTDFAWSGTGEVFRPDRGFFQQSNIGHVRYDASGNMDLNQQPGGFGFAPVIIPGMNDLLWAEAKLRTGDAAGASALIDNSRVGRGNLSSSAAVVANPGSPADGPCMSNGKLAKDGSPCTLWSELLYEYEVELLDLGPASYWNQRRLPVVKATAWERATGCRKPTTGCTVNPNTIFNGPRYIQGLLPGTPREMPIPAKELALRSLSFYTFGGGQAAKGTEAP